MSQRVCLRVSARSESAEVAATTRAEAFGCLVVGQHEGSVAGHADVRFKEGIAAARAFLEGFARAFDADVRAPVAHQDGFGGGGAEGCRCRKDKSELFHNCDDG